MKKFYKENRVFVILMGIALVCIAIIVGIFANYIVKSSTNDKYGNRLDGIKDVEVTEEMKTEWESRVMEKPKVQDATIAVHGKIIYFTIDFEKETTIEEAQNVSIACLEFFDETYSNFYDYQFLVTKSTLEESEKAFPMFGYRKARATTITWSNNSKK